MNTMWAAVLLVTGLVILWKCAELLVGGAVSLAERLGVSPLIIGLTIVAMGTSAPEVAASIAAVLQGSGGGDTAIGNVFGSNVANLALVGGLAALIRPIAVQGRVLRREIPVMIGVGLLLLPVFINDSISRWEAVLMLVIFGVLTGATIYMSRRGPGSGGGLIDAPDELARTAGAGVRSLAASFVLIGVGLAGLAGGAKMTVDGAVFIGRQAGISEGVIGLTVIALGTSLPELVTCVVAALKGQDDVSIGNLVGSNIFNTLLVTGGAGLVRPYSVGARFAGGADYWIMIGASAAFAGVAIAGGNRIGRFGGGILLLGYAAYMVYLFAYTAGV